jgi:hypothetical protein
MNNCPTRCAVLIRSYTCCARGTTADGADVAWAELGVDRRGGAARCVEEGGADGRAEEGPTLRDGGACLVVRGGRSEGADVAGEDVDGRPADAVAEPAGLRDVVAGSIEPVQPVRSSAPAAAARNRRPRSCTYTTSGGGEQRRQRE